VILDGLIVLVVGITVLVSFQQGLLVPLLTSGFWLGPWIWTWMNWTWYLSAVPPTLRGNPVALLTVSLVVSILLGYCGARLAIFLRHRRALRGPDGLLGIFINGGLAGLLMYGLISTLTVFDMAVGPFLNSDSVTAAQAAVLEQTLESNPITARIFVKADLDRLQAETSQTPPATLEAVPQLNTVIGIYRDFVRPQLKGSRLAGRILALGTRIHR
jgi:hypothetical protein